jgi:hypothetical protein
MPRRAETQLTAYEIVSGQPHYGITQGDSFEPYRAEAWREVVRSVGSFAFAGALGRFTARAEERKGHTYWYAYRHVSGTMIKRYIGTEDQLTPDWLEQIADDMKQMKVKKRLGN